MNNELAIVRSFNTILEMLGDRKIDVSGINQTAISNSLVNSSLSNIAFRIQIDDIIIIYYLASKFRWPEMKSNIEKNLDVEKQYILIVNDTI